MPKPRKPVYLSTKPPTRVGWYVYKHVDGYPKVLYLDHEDLRYTWWRFGLCKSVDLPSPDLYSTRRLRKRERVPIETFPVI